MQTLQEIETGVTPEQINELRVTAKNAAAHSHAPYSHFHVGAAVLDDQGHIWGGCNVENASFGLTMCAERNALGAAVCGGARRVRAVGIYTATESLNPPCGACRQVLSEFGRQMEVHLFNLEGMHKVFALNQLLPCGFQLNPTHA